MEDLNETLDQTVSDIFQVLEDLYEKQAALEQALKDGYFSMARARYNMGVKRVNADQIMDADLVASRNVQVKMESDEVNEEGDDVLKDSSTGVEDIFKLCICQDLNKEMGKSENKSDRFLDIGESGIRKRGTGKVSADEANEDDEVEKLAEELEKLSEEENKKFKLSNPINLFGVLVPQALRSCQKSFEDAVKLSIDIANQKHKLKILHKKLDHLKDKKSKISCQKDTADCEKHES